MGWHDGLRSDLVPPRALPPAFLRDAWSRLVRFHAMGLVCAVPILEAASRGGMADVLHHHLGSLPAHGSLARAFEAICLGLACYAALETGCAAFQIAVYASVAALRFVLPRPFCPPAFDARAWPRLYPRAPWQADSMASFWSSCWHALFLQPFQRVTIPCQQYC